MFSTDHTSNILSQIDDVLNATAYDSFNVASQFLYDCFHAENNLVKGNQQDVAEYFMFALNFMQLSNITVAGFYFRIGTQVQCITCGNCVGNSDFSNILPLPVTTVASVQEALYQYTSPETIVWVCHRCGHLRASASRSLLSPPEVV